MSTRAERAASWEETVRLQRVSRARVRQYFTDFSELDGRYPGQYPRLLIRGEGIYLYDTDGRKLLDGGHHLGACQIGHGRAQMAESIARQASTLEYSSLDAGISHGPAAQLADVLAPIVPVENGVFTFSSTGSEANEAAFKLARTYHALRGESGRIKVLSRSGSYHGSSYGAMSATGMPALREPFAPLVPGFVRTSQPSPGRCGYCDSGSDCSLKCADDIERVLLQEGPQTVAAFIGEPVAIQQAVKVPHPDYWGRVREICSRYGVLLIADEVITGFGRTGARFGIENWGVQPDMVTMAKGVTSGYVPLGVTVHSGEMNEVLERIPSKHVNTYAAHPVACAAAITNIEIIERERLVENAARLEHVMRDEMEALQQRHDEIFRTSVIGLLGSVEFHVASEQDGSNFVGQIRHECYERGVLVRGAVQERVAAILFYPPLTISKDEIAGAFATIAEAWDAVKSPRVLSS